MEEELSINVMVFGLPEEDSEQLERSFSEVFQQLGEKQNFEAVRLGKKGFSGASCKSCKAFTGTYVTQRSTIRCFYPQIGLSKRGR